MNDRHDEDLEALLGGIVPRQEPPDEVRQRVFAQVDQVWRQRKRRRWRLPVALAASALLATVLAMLLTSPGPGVSLEVAQGGGIWVDGIFEPAGSQVTVLPGARVEARGGTRLLSRDGVEVRLRQWTRSASLPNGRRRVRTAGPGSTKFIRATGRKRSPSCSAPSPGTLGCPSNSRARRPGRGPASVGWKAISPD